jgi:hypothetical protein
MQSLRTKNILIHFNLAPNPLCQVWVKISPPGEGKFEQRLGVSSPLTRNAGARAASGGGKVGVKGTSEENYTLRPYTSIPKADHLLDCP